MKYVQIPVAMLELGKLLPIDVWDSNGLLLLRKGQVILSQQHKEMLSLRRASVSANDEQAWQKIHERRTQSLQDNGVEEKLEARTTLQTAQLEANCLSRRELLSGWLELQKILRGLLYEGKSAVSPLERLDFIETKALVLLRTNPDECLFILFQALADVSLSYCTTHALLTAVVCELTAENIGMTEPAKRVLFRSALAMNIGMAQAQDNLATLSETSTEIHRKLVRDHPQKSLEILKKFCVTDEDELDIVRWHHELDESSGLAKNLESRRLLRMADGFVAKMAARKTRLATSQLGAAKSIFLGAPADTLKLGAAMATAVGFYPPGTYVQLVNGEKSVSVARGMRANIPHVVSIVNPGGMPLGKYLYRDTTDPKFAIRSPLNAEKIKVKVMLEELLKARMEHASTPR